MLDKIILGLLQFDRHSAYSLQKAMEQSTGFFYGTSQGAINPALKKLSARGSIKGQDKLEGKRKRIEYSITAKGQREFDSWLSSAMEVGRVREDALVRLFFMGHLDRDARTRQIEAYCDELRTQQQALETLVQSINQLLAGRPLTEVEKFRMETLRFGVDYYDFSSRWYEQLLQRQ